MTLRLIILNSVAILLLVVIPIIGRINERTYQAYPKMRKTLWILVTTLLFFNVRFIYHHKPILTSPTRVEEAKRLKQLVTGMYENNPSQIPIITEEYRDMFTEKGYVSIDGEDNVLNIINRYSNYSQKGNKVDILDLMYSSNKVVIKFKITGKQSESVLRLGEFNRGPLGYTNYKEYPIWDDPGNE